MYAMMKAAVVCFTCLAPAAFAADMRMIVDRDPDAVEIYMQLPVPLIPGVLGDLPPRFAQDDGRIKIAPFRNGTADFGDVFFRDVTATIDGTPVALEAMSMMVHPAEFDMPFRDPLDAITAISVCNVPDPNAIFAQDGLTAYLGYIAYPVNGHSNIRVTFPNPIDLEVIEFSAGRRHSTQTITTSGPIDLPYHAPWGWLGWFKQALW
ncbi:MAG: hypothetical protein AAF701_09095 [Pseudomonadota bacterium]